MLRSENRYQTVATSFLGFAYTENRENSAPFSKKLFCCNNKKLCSGKGKSENRKKIQLTEQFKKKSNNNQTTIQKKKQLKESNNNSIFCQRCHFLT